MDSYAPVHTLGLTRFGRGFELRAIRTPRRRGDRQSDGRASPPRSGRTSVAASEKIKISSCSLADGVVQSARTCP